jgi:asparagine synthase (glutamine-hydrolysing)
LVGAAVRSAGTTNVVLRKLSRTFLTLEPELESIYFDNFSVFSRERQRSLLTSGARARMLDGDPYAAALAEVGSRGGSSLVNMLLAADLKTYLHELLMKQDQMSMAASIESRVPFLDHKLVEFAGRLPVAMKLRGLTTKYVLRRAMRGRLPDEILTRKKMGFPTPVGAWLRGPYAGIVEEYVLSERAARRGIFDPAYVRRLVAEHRAGADHTERLWSLVNFEIWQRRFFDGEVVDASAGSAGARRWEVAASSTW